MTRCGYPRNEQIRYRSVSGAACLTFQNLKENIYAETYFETVGEYSSCSECRFRELFRIPVGYQLSSRCNPRHRNLLLNYALADVGPFRFAERV